MMGMVTIAEATDDIIYVPAPKGIPETDWYNIQTALDNAMSGDTIVLAAGDYYIHQPLTKDGFSGSVVGAGIDSTNIIVSTASDGSLFPVIHIDVWDDWPEFGVPIGSQFYTATLFYMSRCVDSVVFSDLTMIMDENGIAEPSYIYDTYTGTAFSFDFIWGYNFGYANIVHVLSDCDTTVERIGLVGANDGTYFQYVNPNHGWYIEGHDQNPDGFGGTHVARDCEFVGMGSNAYQPTILKNAEVIVEDCTFRDGSRGVAPVGCDGLDIKVTDSLFTNLQHSGVMLFGVSGCVADVSHNKMIGSSGVYIQAWDINGYTYVLHEKCYLNIEHNEIVQKDGGYIGGIDILNLAYELDWGDLVIKSNKIHGEGSTWRGPIHTYNAHNAIITNNIITGNGLAAMYIGVASWWDAYDTGVLMQGNNVENFYVYEGFGTAQIWLGPYTSQCKVIGNPANVFDETDDPTTPEYDGNNILVGVK
jgi:hypothetical protein